MILYSSVYRRFSESSKTTISFTLRKCKFITSSLLQMLLRLSNAYMKYIGQLGRLTRVVVFTLEVALQSMAKNVEQFVILIDASKFSFHT